MGYKLGTDCKAYFFTTALTERWDGTGDAPTNTEMTNVKDVTVNCETGEADVTIQINGVRYEPVGQVERQEDADRQPGTQPAGSVLEFGRVD